MSSVVPVTMTGPDPETKDINKETGDVEDRRSWDPYAKYGKPDFSQVRVTDGGWTSSGGFRDRRVPTPVVPEPFMPGTALPPGPQDEPWPGADPFDPEPFDEGEEHDDTDYVPEEPDLPAKPGRHLSHGMAKYIIRAMEEDDDGWLADSLYQKPHQTRKMLRRLNKFFS